MAYNQMMLKDLLGDPSPENLAVMQAMLNGGDYQDTGILNPQGQAPMRQASQMPQQMPQNYLRNQDTGATYDLGPSQQPGPALDYSSAPVEIGGYGKGYRLKGDASRVVLADGRIVDLGRDTGAERKRQLEDLAIADKRQNIATGGVEQQVKMAQLAELMGLDPSQMGADFQIDDRPRGFSGPVGPDRRQQTAQALGVPVAPNVYGGMSRKGRETLQAKEILQAEKRLAEDEANARNQGVLAQDAQRFKQLNEETTTGPIAGSDPVAWIRSIGDDNVTEMKAIQSRLTPKMREPGSGTTSDFDAKMFQAALFGVNKNKGANDAIANAMITKAKAEKDRVAFNSAYLQANNTLRGADAKWAEYAESNPIFDPASEGMPKINGNRKGWREYFSGGQQAPSAPQAGGASGGWGIQRVK